MSLAEALKSIREKKYNHPWEQHKDVIKMWVENRLKSETQIIGEYFALYKNWLMGLLRKHHLKNVEEKVNFAIMRNIARWLDIGKLDQDMKPLLQNIVLRSGDTDSSIPTSVVGAFRANQALHPENYLPLLSNTTYHQLLNHVDPVILGKVALETFRGKNAYNMEKFLPEKLNQKLPFPGTDLLYELYFENNPQLVTYATELLPFSTGDLLGNKFSSKH